MAHVYFHIDLNAFFANAEILLDSSPEGKAGDCLRADQKVCCLHGKL